jgi:hypothetical protein
MKHITICRITIMVYRGIRSKANTGIYYSAYIFVIIGWSNNTGLNTSAGSWNLITAGNGGILPKDSVARIVAPI